MKLILFRHGIAEDLDPHSAWGVNDKLRPLSAEGQQKMELAALGAKLIVGEVHSIAASPLVRALQTAEILAAQLGVPKITREACLAPESRAENMAEWLLNFDPEMTLLLVGHLPSLPMLASYLLNGREEVFFHFKKGAACLIEFAKEAQPGRGSLRWFLPSKILRGLASAKQSAAA